MKRTFPLLLAFFSSLTLLPLAPAQRAGPLRSVPRTSAPVTPSAAPSTAPVPQAVLVPREKVTLSCADSYFGSARENFLLLDENYSSCSLRMPLALRQRWPGERTFYVIPRVSASLLTRDERGKAHWTPLAPLVNPGTDPLHRALPASSYEQVELTGRFGKLTDKAAGNKPDTVSAGGKVTVCAAPVYKGEDACKTFDVAARFKVYTR